MAEKKGAGGRPQTYNEEDGRYGTGSGKTQTEKKTEAERIYNTDGFGGVHTATPAEEKRLKELGIYEEASDTIKLPDEELPKSVGAKWGNYEIILANGETVHLAEGSKLQDKEVFAGKGCKRKIDEVDNLVRVYGGKAEEWQKVKAIGTIVYENGKEEKVELHWYEEPSVGKVKIKEKVR